MQKIRKAPCIEFYDRTWKPRFSVHFGPFIFGPKQDFSQKDLGKSILSVYVNAAISKKSEKFRVSIFHKTWKNSFRAHFNPFWPEKLKTRFFHQNIFEVNFKILCCSSFLQKVRKIPRQFSKKLEKPYFRPNLGSFGSKTLEQNFFSKLLFITL